MMAKPQRFPSCWPWWYLVVAAIVACSLAIPYLVKHSSGGHKLTTLAWFTTKIDRSKPLYIQSHWDYYTPTEWKGFVLHSVAALEPRIEKGDSVFDVGCGVGAALKTLDDEFSLSKIGGVDFVPEAVGVAKEVFPAMQANFLVGDAAVKMRIVPAASYDHVIGIGSLLYMPDLATAGIVVKEALRIARPGASLVFTLLLEPGKCCMRSANIAIPLSWWQENSVSFGMVITKVQRMGDWDGSVIGTKTDVYRKTQDERYAIFLQKTQDERHAIFSRKAPMHGDVTSRNGRSGGKLRAGAS